LLCIPRRNHPVAALDHNNSASPLHTIESDHMGTPRVVIEQDRNLAVWTWPITGEAFGNTQPNEDPDGDGKNFTLDMRFPGQRYDSASGLHYNYFRDYEPGTGRYTQSDPIGLTGGLATYSYVSGNPLIYFDADGLAKFGRGGRSGRGERNHAAKADGTPNPYKHMRPDPNNPKKVLVRDPQTGKWVRKDKPPGFDQQKGGVTQGFLEKMLEFLIPWWLIPSELACSTLDCDPENPPSPDGLEDSGDVMEPQTMECEE